jgi:hypothetical protein
MWDQTFQSLSEMLGRHCRHHHFGIKNRLSEISGNEELLGQLHFRKEKRIDPPASNGVHDLGLVSPETNRVPTKTS